MSGFCVGGRLPYGELFSSLEAGRNEVVLDLAILVHHVSGSLG